VVFSKHERFCWSSQGIADRSETRPNAQAASFAAKRFNTEPLFTVRFGLAQRPEDCVGDSRPCGPPNIGWR
jgi:hypothetical protein